ncbi:MAG: asparagine synthase C-terminal domain-containing protein [Candidatus Micrarchaeota archaeon]
MLTELSDAIQRSIEESMEDRVAVSFSGGLDSSLIAHVAKKTAEVHLFSAGTEDCEDLQFAEKVAGKLFLPLERAVLSEKDILAIYAKCYEIVPSNLLKVELLVPVYAVARLAKSAGLDAIMFGSGAEELFVGYERYYSYNEEGLDLDKILREEFKTLKDRDIAATKKLCNRIGIEARFPLYNNRIAELAFSVPLEERMAERELKKGILRDAGKLLGVPEIALKRKKRAMQYGSGIHKILLKHAEEINTKFPAKS